MTPNGSARSPLIKIVGALLASLTLLAAVAPTADAKERRGERAQAAYIDAIDRVSAMVYDDAVWGLAQEYGLDIVNVAWEDTGRYDNSSVGPNISDVTIQVPRPIPGTDDYTLSLMPVIRFPNFSDTTGDVDIDEIELPIGNEEGRDRYAVPLTEYLDNIGDYLSFGARPNRNLSLLAERDTHVLVSAQAAFLPVPEDGQATFNPVIFNYQSYAENPAVLTIVVTSEGTSATIIDNERDSFGDSGAWGQRLFFNEDGQRASFTADRASDVRSGGRGLFDAEDSFADGGSGSDETVDSPQVGDADVVMIIQVPLKHEALQYEQFEGDYAFESAESADDAAAPSAELERAVIGHGPVEGPFTELDGIKIERDPDFPVRITVQFYKATATGEVTAGDMATIANDIERVYNEADFVGSLVTDGLTGRPTEYDGDHNQPRGWWPAFFWQLNQS